MSDSTHTHTHNTIESKIQAIQDQAQQSLVNQDNYSKVAEYLNRVQNIRSESKEHNEAETQKLLKKFYSIKELAEEKLKLSKQQVEAQSNQEEGDEEAEPAPVYTYSTMVAELKKAYMKYAYKNASLDKLGKDTVFFDSSTAMFLRISRFTNTLRNGEEVERVRLDRFKKDTIAKYIDTECYQMFGSHLKVGVVQDIIRYIKPYNKEFEPLKKKFYGDDGHMGNKFFNTYMPNGFLDVEVNNSVDLGKFTNVYLPKRYPAIDALLKNIAPKADEREFMLNWLSTILNTAEKTKTTFILKGIQRTGKGVFARQIIEHAMHEDNCFIATNANLTDKSSSYLEDRLFITFDEVKGDFDQNKDIGNKVKLIVSEDKISVRSLFSDPREINFYANCIFLSNEDLPVPIDQSDMRISVIETRSKTLKDVAVELGFEGTHDFIKEVKEERDEFLIHLKMCKYNKNQATNEVLQNSVKKVIQDAGSTVQATLKTTFRNKDTETIKEIVEEAIQDIRDVTMIKGEVEQKSYTMDGEQIKSKKIITFDFNNGEMANNFYEEFESGILSNTSLKWFSMITKIDHILKSDSKFGNFWNLILSKAMLINCKWTMQTDNGIKKMAHKERFRKIDEHKEQNTISYRGKEFVLSGKTAVEVEVF